METSAGTFVLDLAAEDAPHQSRTSSSSLRRVSTTARSSTAGHVSGWCRAAIRCRKTRANVRSTARAAERDQGRSSRREDDPRLGRGGARSGQARQRRRPVLHRPRRSTGARRPVHGLRARIRRHGVAEISETPVDDKGVAVERVEIRHVTIRDTPPPAPEAFSTESVQELSTYRAVLEHHIEIRDAAVGYPGLLAIEDCRSRPPRAPLH